jgi:dTDP-3-amino-3,4,6-trideoxy-alpha-D-glucose transaminase
MESKSTVQLNDFRRQWRSISSDALQAVERVGASGWYILGEEVRAFETALAEIWPVPRAVGVGSGLDALEIGLRALGVEPGAGVLTTPLSAFATTLAILRVGARPVFVDVDAAGLIDLARCRERLEKPRPPACLLPVHLYGHALDAEELRALQADFPIRVLEDCAQSNGASSHGFATGTVGHAAATSFYPTKNLGALGDGGAVLTADPVIAERAAVLRHYGQTAHYEYRLVGLNSRLDELHAAVLRTAMLPRLAGWNDRRRRIARRLRAEIEHPRIALPPVPDGSCSCWHLFPVLVAPELRESFQEHLRAMGIASGRHYPRLITEQPALRNAGAVEVAGTLANAQRFAAGEVSLPVHPFLDEEEVSRIVTACNSWSLS